jgi:predicted metal-dependent hydrolase
MTTRFEMSGLVFEVRRGQRRKSLRLTVDRSGELVVYAPLCTPDNELQSWVSGKLLWVHQKLAQKRDMMRDVHPPEFVSGESIFYLGRSYRLRIVDKARTQQLKLRNIFGGGSQTKVRHGSARDRLSLNV